MHANEVMPRTLELRAKDQLLRLSDAARRERIKGTWPLLSEFLMPMTIFMLFFQWFCGSEVVFGHLSPRFSSFFSVEVLFVELQWARELQKQGHDVGTVSAA